MSLLLSNLKFLGTKKYFLPDAHLRFFVEPIALTMGNTRMFINSNCLMDSMVCSRKDSHLNNKCSFINMNKCLSCYSLFTDLFSILVIPFIFLFYEPSFCCEIDWNQPVPSCQFYKQDSC